MRMCAAGPGLNYYARCPSCQQNWLQLADSWAPGMTCPNCGLAVPQGAIIGRFQLVREISSGGLGNVYEAIDSNTGRLVAVKMLKTGVLGDAAAVSRFAQEAQIAASLSHPNVAEVYDFGQAEGTYFLAMEMLEHGSLAQKIQVGPLPEREVLKVGLDIARGLQAASAKGLLHRDIKPGNIVFDPHGRAKLVDFGLAMPLDEVRRGDENAWGSPYYISPERLDGSEEDFRSDIYSLGASLFHAAAGRPPFKATSASVAAWKHLKAQRVSVKAFAPHLSEETASVINRCIERRPSDRYRNHFELIEALESALKHAMQSPETAAAPAGPIGGERQSDKTLRWISLAAVLVLLMAGGIFFAAKRTGKNVLEESMRDPATVARVQQDVPLRPSDTVAHTTSVGFTEPEGYDAGDLDRHPDWHTDSRPTWQVSAAGGTINNSLRQDSECRAYFRRAAFLPAEKALRGSVRFQFGGLGTQTSQEPWRVILSIKVGDRTKPGNRAFEINWVKMASRPDVYESHFKLLNEASELGDMVMLGTVAIPNTDAGDDTSAPGDPSDVIELAYELTKGHNEAVWVIGVKFTNVTKGKTIGTFEKRDIATKPAFFESVKYYASLGANGYGQPIEVSQWSLEGEPVQPTGESGELFSGAQGYQPGDLGAHPMWTVQGAPSWRVADAGGAIQYTHQPNTSSAAVYQMMAQARPGNVIVGSFSFSFNGFGRSVTDNYRDIVKLCIAARPDKSGSGVEMVFHRTKDSDENYSLSVRTTNDTSGTGNLGGIGNLTVLAPDAGDSRPEPGDPSDVLKFDYELKKGPSESFWSFVGKLSNVTTGKELGSFRNEAFPTVPEFYASPGYLFSIRGTSLSSGLEFKSFRFGSDHGAAR